LEGLFVFLLTNLVMCNYEVNTVLQPDLAAFKSRFCQGVAGTEITLLDVHGTDSEHILDEVQYEVQRLFILLQQR